MWARHTLVRRQVSGLFAPFFRSLRSNPMNFLGRILRFLFWALVLSWSLSLLRRLVARMAGAAAPPKGPIDVAPGVSSQKLVRDPVCGMHLAESLALAANRGGEAYFFCSEECRDRFFRGDLKKFAANG